MAENIEKFIDQLSKQKVDKSKVFNFYHEDDNFPQYFTTRMNLLVYLTQMKEKKPKTLFVGEAPGKDGCAITGIPFTSENIMSKINSFDLFGFPKEIEMNGKTVKLNENLQKEKTATMVWNTLINLNFCPLLWNAFPYNPFDPNTKKNRKPTQSEIEIGKKYLTKLLELYKIKNVVAVGNAAEDILKQLKINCHKVPHPSYGNKKKFNDGIKGLIVEGKIN
ncbi:MAG: uracil-DNA glycosylase [Bacteroidetes bacterium]|nr:uracil-DNA glycosylase [Bacteroidota bacterium]